VTFRIEYLAECQGHVAQIAEWQHQQFGYLNPSGTLGDRRQRLIASLQIEHLPISLAAISEENQLIGSASILASTLTHKHLTPWLSSVFVPAEHRGKGIASALSLRGLREAARLGFSAIYLFTPHNESLYARLGWRAIDRIVHNKTPLTIMSRQTMS
jgi:predicted N-acetyltransferase YhbS